MKLIVGLGNPGPAYERNLHNAGFMILDQLAARLQVASFRDKFHATMAKCQWEGEDVVLMKPTTFMNRSGQAISACLHFFKIPVQETVVVSDDLDLEPGKVRFRLKGGHGGHNGMRSAIEHLQSQDFKRVRIGVGRPPAGMQVSDYVLSNWTEPNLEKFHAIQDEVVERLVRFISNSAFDSTSFSADMGGTRTN